MTSNGQMLKKKNLHYYYNTPGKGLVLEVDSEYPKKLNKLHNDYPLAPEKRVTVSLSLHKLMNDSVFGP